MRISKYEKELQLTAVISKKFQKSIVKFYAKESNIYVRIKYINIQRWSQVKKYFYLNALSNINYSLHTKSNHITEQIRYGLTSNNYLYIQDSFIQDQNYQQLYLSNLNNLTQSQRLKSHFIKQLHFCLLNCFIETINLNTIITPCTLFPRCNQFIDFNINRISFVGIPLIIFQQSIQSDAFQQIYNYIDPNIFKREPCKRLGHQQKVYNYVALLLDFIMKTPVKLLKDSELGQYISIHTARQLIQKKPQTYQKYLKLKCVQLTIKEKQRIWGIQQKSLLNLFKKILVENKLMTWSQIKSYLTPQKARQIVRICDQKQEIYYGSNIKFQNIEYMQFYLKANRIWKEFSDNQRNYFIQKGIVEKKQNYHQCLDQNFQLFITIMMEQKINAIQDGSIYNQFIKIEGINMKGRRIVQKYMQILINMQNTNKQSQEVNSFHIQWIKYAQQAYVQQKKYFYGKYHKNKQQTNYMQSFKPQLFQDKFKKLYQLMKVKLRDINQISDKRIVVEDDRLKTYTSYLTVFR